MLSLPGRSGLFLWTEMVLDAVSENIQLHVLSTECKHRAIEYMNGREQSLVARDDFLLIMGTWGPGNYI